MDKTTMLECLINHYTDGNKAAGGEGNAKVPCAESVTICHGLE